MKKQLAILVMSVALLIVLSGCGESFASSEVFATSKDFVKEANAGVNQIMYDDFKKMMEDEEIRIVIDVREQSEFEEGFINQENEDGDFPYSETYVVNIPRGLLEFKIGDSEYWDEELWIEMPAKDELIVVYCKVGGRAALAAHTLQQMGYTNVYNLLGGYRIWLDPSLPIELEESDSGG